MSNLIEKLLGKTNHQPSYIMDRMRSCDPVIFHKNDRAAELGVFSDYFFSFCVWRGNFYSLSGRYVSRSYYEIGEPQFHDDQTILTRYKSTPSGLVPVEVRDISIGGDPHVVSDGENAYAIITGTHFSSVRTMLYNFATRSVKQITLAEEAGHPGKNWQPFLKDGRLFAIHELTPFRIIEIDVETGFASIAKETQIDLDVRAGYDPYTIFRGGSNCVSLDDNLFGIGRITTQRYRHIPFFWSFDDEEKYTFSFCEFFDVFRKYGYNVIDPTALFIHNGDLYVGFSASEREWAFSQIVSDYLLCFPKGKSKKSDLLLSDYLQNRVPAKIDGKPNLKRHLFQCAEMPRFPNTKLEMGGVLSSGEPGYVVYGPYLDLVVGKYKALLAYTVRTEYDGEIGVFDVHVQVPETSTQPAQSTVLASAGIIADGNGNAEIELDFEIPEGMDGKLEFRVRTDQAVLLNVYYIRTWGAELNSDPDAKFSWADIELTHP